jgi:hypothetical protein
MENKALLTVIALMLAGAVTIMLATSEADDGDDALSGAKAAGAAFERHRSLDEAAYSRPSRTASESAFTPLGPAGTGYGNGGNTSSTAAGI